MDEIMTALVIVRRPGVDAEMLVDSSNVGQILPETEDFETVRRHFAAHGFSPTAGYAGTFTIEASTELFADLLPALLSPPSDPRAGENPPETPAAPSPSWLAPVAHHIAAITQSEPVELDSADP